MSNEGIPNLKNAIITDGVRIDSNIIASPMPDNRNLKTK